MLICFDLRNGNGCSAQNRDGAQCCAQCGAFLRFALQLYDPGTVIANYHILNIVGYGGFGAVYEAEQVQNSRMRVALKETFDPSCISSFKSEFSVLSTLRHPNLPLYIDMFEYQANGYLVMEFVPGQSLIDILNNQRSPLLESQVTGYVLQICDLLMYLHNQNPAILHRDIKPDNIRLTPTGLIKLVDFGLFKQGVQQTRKTIRIMGTPAYAPPEQYGSGTDHRSDIYSLGATIYHLITGNMPLSATDRISKSIDPLSPPKDINNNISQHTSNAIMISMSLRREDRYNSADEFKRALIESSSTSVQPIKNSLPASGNHGSSVSVATFRIIIKAQLNAVTKKGILSQSKLWHQTAPVQVHVELVGLGGLQIDNTRIFDGDLHFEDRKFSKVHQRWYHLSDKDANILKQNLEKYVADLHNQKWNTKNIIEELGLGKSYSGEIMIIVYYSSSSTYDERYIDQDPGSYSRCEIEETIYRR